MECIFRRDTMIRLLATAGLAALLTACAAPSPGGDRDPMHGRGSTPQGASNAALLGFHGPVYRAGGSEGPN
jgi:hypothetical protein